MNTLARAGSRFAFIRRTPQIFARRNYSSAHEIDSIEYTPSIDHQAKTPVVAYYLVGASAVLLVISEFQVSQTKKHLRAGGHHHGEKHH
mmetsp:Transcript_8249/g.13871  ORF Transcript_8249/g.13871 Transcript_8249/m.13871 type:complete len:89 (-) Transcript_8249:117-383(-)